MAHILTIDWQALERSHITSPCCWRWVSNESIRKSLRRGGTDDLSRPWDHNTHHAARIATLARLLDEGKTLDPLTVELSGSYAHLHDGHHRLRAYQFRKVLLAVPVEVSFG